MTTRRIAFLDVDGTILLHGSIVAESTIDAVRTARQAGHLVFLATGRSAADIHPTVRGIGFDGAITNGGAYAVVGETTVVADPMPRAAVDELTALFDSHRMHYVLQADAGLFAPEPVRVRLAEVTRRVRAMNPQAAAAADDDTADRIRDIALADRDAIAKAVFLSEAHDSVERLRRDLGDRYHVIPGSIPMPGSNGEIGMPGVTKGAAIRSVLDHVGMHTDTALGVGDSWNDVEMFEVCGTGVAMGNAPDALKALADDVTTSVSADGVANAFRRHGLI
ncbi:Cof-type HAD-IIB family hydrolase [Microbacterium aquimaris]|uniref:HAD family hydrolase n=1 Tax=Microbacterium aquimaris TaxID=459816 RepID=A0ABU5N4N8_9MICO|nr:HAD family hydrolase [Microbacterium aquimaris]MDZ8160995.1 HAD family hydrolase [Microbacterium aquimaris]